MDIDEIEEALRLYYRKPDADDQVRLIGQALAFLQSEPPGDHQVQVIEKIYRDRKSLRWMESRGLGDRRTLATRAEACRQFVAGVLFGAQVAAGR